MRRSISLAALLLVAACSGGESAGNNGSEEAVNSTEPVPDNATLDAQNSVVPIAPAASPSPVAASGFPQPFQGRWALGEADCDPAKADIAKGLMTVTADGVRHYESRGRATRVEVASPTKLTAELAFTGEGQEWTRRATWTLTDAGKTLTAEVPDDPEPPMRLLRYTRCPA
jgi:hypothetical protein